MLQWISQCHKGSLCIWHLLVVQMFLLRRWWSSHHYCIHIQVVICLVTSFYLYFSIPIPMALLLWFLETILAVWVTSLQLKFVCRATSFCCLSLSVLRTGWIPRLLLPLRSSLSKVFSRAVTNCLLVARCLWPLYLSHLCSSAFLEKKTVSHNDSCITFNHELS